jgi:hypothetical protein
VPIVRFAKNSLAISAALRQVEKITVSGCTLITLPLFYSFKNKMKAFINRLFDMNTSRRMPPASGRGIRLNCKFCLLLGEGTVRLRKVIPVELRLLWKGI